MALAAERSLRSAVVADRLGARSTPRLCPWWRQPDPCSHRQLSSHPPVVPPRREIGIPTIRNALRMQDGASPTAWSRRSGRGLRHVCAMKPPSCGTTFALLHCGHLTFAFSRLDMVMISSNRFLHFEKSPLHQPSKSSGIKICQIARRSGSRWGFFENGLLMRFSLVSFH